MTRGSFCPALLGLGEIGRGRRVCMRGKGGGGSLDPADKRGGQHEETGGGREADEQGRP